MYAPRGSGQIRFPPKPRALQPGVHFIYRAKDVSLGLVGDLAQDCHLCFVGLSKSELAVSCSAGEVIH